MADAIVSRFQPGIARPHPIEKVILVPSRGGIFDVKADGKLLFSKHAAHRHAEKEEILKAIRELLEA